MTLFSPPASLAHIHAPVSGWASLRTVEVVLNVTMFVPLGAAVGAVARARWLWLLAALSVAIEVAQLALADRQTELIDVATNGLGAVLGFAAARWVLTAVGEAAHPQ